MPLISPFFRVPGRWRTRRARRQRMALQYLTLLILALVVLPLYIIYKPPKFVVNSLQRRFPEVLFQVPTTRKIVALTIDDTPSPYTTEILDILKANSATATFFTIGNQVPGQAAKLQGILLAGSELGNHAMHDEPSINLASDTLQDEIRTVNTYIEEAYAAVEHNRTAHYFRPGSGIFSQRILDVAKDAGYQTILGSIYPHDPFISYPRINGWHILSMLRPGAIIICHDRRSWTPPMLARILPEIRKRGYEIVTVSALLEAAAGK